MRITTTILFLIPFLVGMSGCASSQKQKLLNERVGALNNEVARLDAELQSTNVALKSQEDKNKVLEATLQETHRRAQASQGEGVSQASGAGLYRTPSGFELAARDIQIALKNAGYYHDEIDEKIGPNARAALRAFQQDNGLKADGVCGRETWSKLQPYLSAGK